MLHSTSLERVAKPIYRRCIRPWLPDSIIFRHRFKLLAFDIWFSYPLLRYPLFLSKVLYGQWHLRQETKIIETGNIIQEILKTPPKPGEIMVEAGCFQGGTTAQFSLACARMGYRLHVYDSFQGVREWGFQFASPQWLTEKNVARFGNISVCEFHPGWFADTLLYKPIPHPVRFAYIDCDSADGTFEALSGILPSLTPDGVIFSQDFHISSVRELLLAADTWEKLRMSKPQIVQLTVKLIRISFTAPLHRKFQPKATGNHSGG
jgi:O-methyltransferase